MSSNNNHYRKIIQKQSKTQFARCGYRDRFDPFALNTNKRVCHLYSEMFRLYLSVIPCETLLDIGCGTGIYFATLTKYAQKIEAIDISEDMIDIADNYCQDQLLTNIAPKVGSAEALDYKNESFDVVIALDAIHHVLGFEQMLHEVHRVLKSKGHFLVFEPNIQNPLMFFAHAIPKEERLALGRSRPATLLSTLERKFETVRWDGICELVTQCAGIKRILLDTYLTLWNMTGLKKLYPRQIWLGRKR